MNSLELPMRKIKSIADGLYLGCSAVIFAITPAQTAPFFQGLLLKLPPGRSPSPTMPPEVQRNASLPAIGQSFHKTASWIVWTVDSFNENTEPVHARLIRLDDPTTYITVSIDVLSDPHFWSVADL